MLFLVRVELNFAIVMWHDNFDCNYFFLPVIFESLVTLQRHDNADLKGDSTFSCFCT